MLLMVVVRGAVGSAADAPASGATVASQALAMLVRYGATPSAGAAHWVLVLVWSRPAETVEPLSARTCSIASSASWAATCWLPWPLVVAKVVTKNLVNDVITMPISMIETSTSIRLKPVSGSRPCVQRGRGTATRRRGASMLSSETASGPGF
jgi:hypothetical protein